MEWKHEDKIYLNSYRLHSAQDFSFVEYGKSWQQVKCSYSKVSFSTFAKEN